MIGWGEFWALSSALIWALAVVLFRRAGSVLPAFELNLFKNLLGFALLLPTMFWLEGMRAADFSISEIGITALSGFVGIALADTWYLRALQLMGAARTGIVASLFSPFVILLSVLFLGETFIGWQLLGLVLVMAGILLVTWRENRRDVDAAEVTRGLFFAVGAVFLMAVGIVMVKEILETRPFLWTAEIRFGGGIAGMLIYMLASRRHPFSPHRFRPGLPWVTIVTASFFGGYLAMIVWLAGYKLIPASVASVLNESTNAWIVLLAWLLLGEPLSRRRVAGLALTSAGVVTMLLV